MTDAPPADPRLMTFARDLAQEAGQHTLKWFRSSGLDVEIKGDGSPVTVADKSAERLIRERIDAAYPGSSVIGEEEGANVLTTPLLWTIDPIDGTKGFVRGVPLYSTLLAIDDEHGPAVGVIDLPALGQTIWAGRGLGAHTTEGIARVSSVSRMDQAFVTSSEVGRWTTSCFDEFKRRGASIRGWGDGYGFYLVATGQLEAMIDHVPGVGNHSWDFAPCPVILSEAGGRFASLRGDSDTRAESAFGSNSLLYEELLEVFATTMPG